MKICENGIIRDMTAEEIAVLERLAAEQPTPEPTLEPTPVVRRIPQTGDDSPLALLVVLAGLSAIVLAVLLYWRHRHKANDLPPENDPQYEVKDHESRDL